MALTTNLVDYYKYDESSGNAADTVGSNTLTNNNTVTSSGNLRIKIEYLDTAGTKTLRFNRSKPTVADQAVDYNTTLTVGTWYHLVMTYDATTEIGYLNGASVASGLASGDGAGQSDAFNVGRNDNASNYSSASYDEMGIWTRALTAAEASQLYNGGAGLPYPLTVSTSKNLLLLGVG